MPTGCRYLVISELFLPTKGGTAVWFAEVYRRLGGREIHIVTAAVPGDRQVDAQHPNTVHRVNLARVAWLRPESLLMYLRLFATAFRLSLKHSFDAVHAGRVLPEGGVAWAVARLTRRPLVVYAHGEEITTWRQPGKFKAMCFVYRHADHVIANSDFTRAELLKLGVRPERITLICPGVDTQRYSPGLPTADLRQQLGIHASQALILSVGRLQRRKGFDHVIRALPRLVAQGFDVHYALIGIGEDEDYLNHLAEKLGVTERVHRLGHVDADDLPRWYNAADVFAMPNRAVGPDTEGFGMVFLEAAACGKPVLAGQAGGTGAAVIDGHTGLRVDGDNELAVTDSLARLLGDPALARRLGDAGRQRAVTEFDWTSVAQKTRKL